jgi:hypothetical protein
MHILLRIMQVSKVTHGQPKGSCTEFTRQGQREELVAMKKEMVFRAPYTSKANSVC